MISIFDFTDYRDFLAEWITNGKTHTRGLQGKLAEAAGISSSMMSFILKGDKHLSLEQAAEIAEFVGFNSEETDYFFLLAEFARAGSVKLRKLLQRRVEEQSRRLGNRVSKRVNLSPEVQAVYYSSWTYSGIRNLTATPGGVIASQIAEHLSLPLSLVTNVVDFLVGAGLCRREGENLTYGPQKTHVESSSPFVNKHHQNWRLRGFQEMEKRQEGNLFFTSPMSLSRKAALEIRKTVPKVVKQIMEIAGPSDSEIVACFNIDWFEY